MTVDVISMLERMAAYGTAPDEGCNLFGVGHEQTLKRIRDSFLVDRFGRGASTEKFVVGPFGSGKTHFLRQLMEMARDLNCVTAEVTLNKDVDFTQLLAVYREVTRELRIPGSPGRGIRALLVSVPERIRAKSPAPGPLADKLVQSWVAGLSQFDCKLEAFGRVARKGLEAYLNDDEDTFEAACRWLGGEVGDRQLAARLNVSVVARAEQNQHARRTLLSLFQFIRHAQYGGTVVGFDEAEQGFAVNQKKLNQILSMLQSGINATVDLDKGAALVTYAITPDLRDEMMRFPALQQRVSDPSVGRGFHDGNLMAAMIDLTRRADPLQDLGQIGEKLVDLLYTVQGQHQSVDVSEVRAAVQAIAHDVADFDLTTSNRRTMVKRTCSMLVQLYHQGIIADGGTESISPEEDEV